MKKPKYKIGQKVQFRHSSNDMVYKIYAINIFKGGRIGYNINIDSTYEVVDEYQLKKFKSKSIGYETNGTNTSNT